MLTPERVRSQVQQLTEDFISLSLCNRQNFPSMKNTIGNIIEIGFSHDHDFSLVLKNLPYRDIYYELERIQAYNIKMMDGALIQLLYRFKNNSLSSHRLGFFPSPDLEQYQNYPGIYENEEIYAEIIQKNIVPFPIRFDYDATVGIELDHPMSHLTLGQYKNCRIPVSAPLTPYIFISFILRSFYNTAFRKFTHNIRQFSDCFQDTIIGDEHNVVYVHIPTEARGA